MFMLFGTSVIKSKPKAAPLDRELRRMIYSYERCGAGFSVAASAFLRVAYKLSGGEVWALVFASANNSPWEKTKALAVSYIFWAFVELACIRVPFRRFVVSKTAGLYLLILMGCAAYVVCGLFAENMAAAADAGVSALLMALAFALSYRAAAYRHGIEKYFYASLVLLAAYYAAFSFLTAVQPNVFLFR